MISDRIFFEKIIGKLDPSERKDLRAYIARKNRERGLLKSVFNAIRDGVMVIDGEHRIVQANRSAIEMLGLPEQIENEPVSRFIRDIPWNEILGRKSNDWFGASRQEIEIRYPEHKFLLFYMLPNEEEKGSAIIILQDITESRRNTEKRVESEKNQLVSLLAAGVAHELGNPLNSLSLNLQLLGRLLSAGKPKKNDLSKALELLRAAENEISRLDMIIRDFLRAVRPTPLRLSKVSLMDIVSEVLSFTKEELADRMISVNCISPSKLPQISADPEQLRQAFFNIIRNAAQAMPGGGSLLITCSADDDAISLSFKDEGVGIAPDQIGRIFNPYFTTKKNGGGLGLVIVDRIVREHGASLSLESSPGKGATFTIKFPSPNKRTKMLPPPSDEK